MAPDAHETAGDGIFQNWLFFSFLGLVSNSLCTWVKFLPFVRTGGAIPAQVIVPQNAMFGLGILTFAGCLFVYVLAQEKSRLHLWSKLAHLSSPELRRPTAMMAGCGTLLMVGQLFLSLSVLVQPQNQAVAAAITSTTSIFVAIVCRALYGERISPSQTAGMAITLAGVATMVLSVALTKASGYLSPVYALVVTAPYTLSQIMEKYGNVKHMGRAGLLVHMGASGLCGCVLLCVQFSMAGELGISGINATFSLMAGWLSGLLTVMRNTAVRAGRGMRGEEVSPGSGCRV